MSKTILTRAAVAEALDKVIIERGGDYVYDTDEHGGCFYSFEDGSPACIVGAIVALAAPESFEELKYLEAPTDDGNGAVRRTPCGSVRGIVHDGHLLAESSALATALSQAQSVQDSGGTWEAARSAFVASLREADELGGRRHVRVAA